MARIPSYPKVVPLGVEGTEQVVRGEYYVEEKVDGSQFRFGWTADGKIHSASHHAELAFDQSGMFDLAVKWVNEHTYEIAVASSVVDEWYLRKYGGKDVFGVWFFGEYLRQAKHNTLEYARTPHDNIMLFDVGVQVVAEQPYIGAWIRPDDVAFAKVALELGLERAPLLATGCNADVTDISDVPPLESFLGGTIIEGVVVKNYDQHVWSGSVPSPLFVKVVRRAFRETNAKQWSDNSRKGRLDRVIRSYASNEARWQKAIQELRDRGELTGTPRDIGALCKIIEQDAVEEAELDVKAAAWAAAKPEVARLSTRGFPEWYKSKLGM